jgi:peptide methionine sulfoxide reductase MsrB
MYTHIMSANFTQSKEELKKILEHETYRVTQEKATEAPFTGKYDHHFEDGK